MRRSRARNLASSLAIDARARGVAARRARYRPIVAVPERAPIAFATRFASSIIAELTTAMPDQGIVPLVPAIFRSNAASCSSIAR